jgi:hypothetical protein
MNAPFCLARFTAVSLTFALAASWGCSSPPKPPDASGSGGTSSSGSSTDAGGAAGESSSSTGNSSSTKSGSSSSTNGGKGGSASGSGGSGGGNGGGAGAGPIEIPDPCEGVDEPEMLPDLVEDELDVGPGCYGINRTRMTDDAVLTVEPGTKFLVSPAGYLSTGQTGSNDSTASIIAVGTAEAPIVFTSAAPFPVAGNWECVHVAKSSPGSEFRHVIIEYGGSECVNGGTASLYVDGIAAITDSRISDSAQYGVQLDSQAVNALEFNNNTFVDNELPSIAVTSNLLTSLGEGLSFEMTDVDGSEVANPADAIEVSSSMTGIRNGDVLNHGVPYVLFDGIRVGQNQAAIVEAGTVIQLGSGSFDAHNGYLEAVGSADEPIVFTSAADEPAAGDWPCIILGENALLDQVVVEYAGSGLGCVTDVDQATGIYLYGQPQMSNVTVRDVSGPAVYLGACSDVDQAWCDGGVSTDNVDTPAFECEDSVDACAG